MAFNIPNLFLNITDPISKPEKFLWKELPGDPPKIFGKSLDMKAQINICAPRHAELTLIARDQTTKQLGPFRTITAAKQRAETEYSRWIKKASIIEAN